MSFRPITPATVTALGAIVFFGAIFGFFYAWMCSTLWGLDTIDPRAAIEAMQGMNASVQNPVFFAIFFMTPVVGGFAAILAWSEQRRTMAILLGVAAICYALGGILWTARMNLPLNEGLALVDIPTDVEAAREIWAEYSSDWQFANLMRTIFSGLALLIAAAGLLFSARTGNPAGNNSASSQRSPVQVPAS